MHAIQEHQTDAFGAYKLYLALRLHFTSDSYDAVKYNYKTHGGDFDKFRNKPEAYWFNSLAKKYSKEELIQVFVAQFTSGKKWGGMHTSSIEFEITYTEWRKRIESLSYTFEQELSAIKNLFVDNQQEGILADLFVVYGDRPFIIDMHLKKRVSIETVTILDILTGFVLKCDSSVKDTILWPTIKRSIRKYEPFLEIDKAKFKNILLQYFPLRGEAG
jgi:hypothetical protein